MARELAAWLLLFSLSAVAENNPGIADAEKNLDRDLVHALLKQHADVNAAQGDGATALHWAAHWNDVDSAQLLIAAGANVNAATDLGVTPLYLACENGNAAIAEKLLAAGADANAVAQTGVSPLMMASRSGSVEAVRALLGHGAKTEVLENSEGQTALMWAVAQSHPDVVRLLVEHNAAVNARSNSRKLLFNTSGPGSNLLAGAKEKGGAPKVIPVGGSTPVLFAARNGCIECAKILLDHGANKDDTAPDGTSALVLAAHSGQGLFAAFLLDAGANPNADGAGYAALHAAVLKDDLTLIKALLAHKANPNLQLASGTPVRRGGPDFGFPAYLIGATPFLLAAKYASPDMMRVLAAGGADLRLPTNDGTTAIIAAAGADHRTGGPPGTPPAEEPDALAAVAAALDLGCDVNAVNQAGNSALHIAALRGYNTIVKLLLEKGARIDIKNKRGQTPLTITPGEFKSTADLLRKAGETQ